MFGRKTKAALAAETEAHRDARAQITRLHSSVAVIKRALDNERAVVASLTAELRKREDVARLASEQRHNALTRAINVEAKAVADVELAHAERDHAERLVAATLTVAAGLILAAMDGEQWTLDATLQGFRLRGAAKRSTREMLTKRLKVVAGHGYINARGRRILKHWRDMEPPPVVTELQTGPQPLVPVSSMVA